MAAKRKLTPLVDRYLPELPATDPIYRSGFSIGGTRSAKPLPAAPAAKPSTPEKIPGGKSPAPQVDLA
jgi:hypothetical protein